MSDSQARAARDVYDHDEVEDEHGSPSRRRRPVADWGVGDDMFEHMPRRRFSSHAAEGPPRGNRFRAEPAQRDEPRERPESDRRDEPRERLVPVEPEVADRRRDQVEPEVADRPRDEFEPAPPARRRREPESWMDEVDVLAPVPRDAVAGDGAAADGETALSPEDRRPREQRESGPIPRGQVDDGRRTIVIGRDEDVPSEIAAITADRDLGDEPAAAAPRSEAPAPPERRTVRIGGRPEGALSQARFHEGSHRRRDRQGSQRLNARPELLAAWAFALGLLLILIAVLTSH